MEKRLLLTYLFILLISFTNAQVKILFDASKAETAGNADWIIDADQHNLVYSGTTGLPYISSATNKQSNPQRIPTAAQSGITSNTPETYWDGALSAWSVDCVKNGYQVETLPYNGVISYGNTSNAQDLSNYKIFVVVEPNILFSASEKTAIINFVQNGGSLFMVSDHITSDRNFDGYDSPQIWDDLIHNNGIKDNPFGIVFDSVTISGTSSTLSTFANDSLLHNTTNGYGNVTKVLWTSGTTITINPTINPTVRAAVFKSGTSTSSKTNILVAYARYGLGKVVAFGDSSPFDDGTGDPNDVLYTGYTVDAAGNHEKLIMNATIWLATSSPLPVELVNFNAKEQSNKIFVKWQTATEVNTSHFNVQKSNDGSNFKTIGTVASKGNSSYSFVDVMVDKLSSTIYYRLEIVDKDGSKTYSKVESLMIKYKQQTTNIYPNPAKDLIYLTNKNIKQVKITNSFGSVVVVLNNVENNKPINICNLASGVYAIQIITHTGETVFNKFIKE